MVKPGPKRKWVAPKIILPKASRPYGVVYCIMNLGNGKRYIGQTVGDPKSYVLTIFASALSSARTAAKRRDHPLYQDIRIRGPSSFQVRILATASDQKELDLAERASIQLYDTIFPNGYNLMGGGKLVRHSIYSDITVQRRSEGVRASHSTAEFKAKASAAQSNRFADPDQREHQRQKTIEQFADPEKRARHKAAFSNPETLCKILEANTGLRWANNGSENIRLKPDEAVPEGWSEGMLYPTGARENAQARGRHIRWHVKRGRTDTSCSFCAESALS